MGSLTSNPQCDYRETTHGWLRLNAFLPWLYNSRTQVVWNTSVLNVKLTVLSVIICHLKQTLRCLADNDLLKVCTHAKKVLLLFSYPTGYLGLYGMSDLYKNPISHSFANTCGTSACRPSHSNALFYCCDVTTVAGDFVITNAVLPIHLNAH